MFNTLCQDRKSYNLNNYTLKGLDIIEERINNHYIGLVDYKDLEGDILSSIHLGKPLTGKDGVLAPLIKKLLEASLEAEMSHHLSNN